MGNELDFEAVRARSAGFISTDGGTTWRRIPGGPSSRTDISAEVTGAVMLCRVEEGTNMSGAYVELE